MQSTAPLPSTAELAPSSATPSTAHRLSFAFSGLSLAAGALILVFWVKGIHLTWPVAQPFSIAVILAPAAAFAGLVMIPFTAASRMYSRIAFLGALVAFALSVADWAYFASNLHR